MMSLPFRTEWEVYQGRYWGVILHDNQSYLGRCIVYLKSRELDDPLKLNVNENDELWFEILQNILVPALRKSFQPDRINYAHLANTDHFVHWHVVPRYENPNFRDFSNTNFVDQNRGKNFDPAPQHCCGSEVMEQIRTQIMRHMRRGL